VVIWLEVGRIGWARCALLHSAVNIFVARFKSAHWADFRVSPSNLPIVFTVLCLSRHRSQCGWRWGAFNLLGAKGRTARSFQAGRWYALKWHRGADSGYCVLASSAAGAGGWRPNSTSALQSFLRWTGQHRRQTDGGSVFHYLWPRWGEHGAMAKKVRCCVHGIVTGIQTSKSQQVNRSSAK